MEASLRNITLIDYTAAQGRHDSEPHIKSKIISVMNMYHSVIIAVWELLYVIVRKTHTRHKKKETTGYVKIQPENIPPGEVTSQPEVMNILSKTKERKTTQTGRSICKSIVEFIFACVCLDLLSNLNIIPRFP